MVIDNGSVNGCMLGREFLCGNRLTEVNVNGNGPHWSTLTQVMA